MTKRTSQETGQGNARSLVSGLLDEHNLNPTADFVTNVRFQARGLPGSVTAKAFFKELRGCGVKVEFDGTAVRKIQVDGAIRRVWERNYEKKTVERMEEDLRHLSD